MTIGSGVDLAALAASKGEAVFMTGAITGTDFSNWANGAAKTFQQGGLDYDLTLHVVSDQISVTVELVPEPGSVALATVGGLGLLWLLRRRRARGM